MMIRDVKLASIVIATALAAGGGIAGAQRVGIVTASAPEAPSSARRLTEELAVAAAARDAEPVANPMEVASERIGERAVPAQRLAGFGRVRALTQEGWRSYLQVQYDRALTRLAEARQEAERLLDLEGGSVIYAEVSLRLGAVKLELGRTAEAADDFRLAAALDADREVTNDEFKRSVVDAYRAALTTVRTAARRRIEVSPSRVYAPVEIDGVERGRAPLDVELEEGLHAIVVRADGRAAAIQVVQILPGDAAAIELELPVEPLSAAIARGASALEAGTGEAEATATATALGIYADLDHIVLAAAVWRRGAPALLGQWCDLAPVQCGGVVEIGYARPEDLPAAARKLWIAAEAGTRRFPPLLLSDVRLTEAERAPGAVKKRGRRWYKSPWLWLGTATAALGVTAALLLTRDDNVQPVVDIDPCQFTSCD